MATRRLLGAGEHPGRGPRVRLMATLIVVLIALRPGPCAAATLRLDTTLPGADSDAILDGFPGLATLDGFGDLAGNALAVSLKDGVTEERAIVELPLAPLTNAAVGAAQITSATLHFNIDDVLTTFGPGTDFDGTAAERIYVATYAGDGLVDLLDFAAGGLAAIVAIGPQGSITDSSVRTGGPIGFAADLTASVKQLVASGATHIGIVLSTDDSPTGTSIDDRGDGGTGAPGTAGATMPYIDVVTVDATPTPEPTATPGATATATPTPPATATPPNETPSPAATPTPVVTRTPSPTGTGGPVFTPTPVATTATPSPGLPTPRPSDAPTPTGSATTTPGTPTPHGSATPVASLTPTAVPSATAAPVATPTPVLTATPSATRSPGSHPTPTPRPILTASPRATASPGDSTPTPTPAVGAQLATLRPEASGDQLVLLYDARDGFTTFLNLHNLGDDGLRVRIVLCDSALEPQLAHEEDLAPGSTRTLDVASLRAGGLPPGSGAAFAIAIDDDGDGLVTRALAGSFTIANVSTGSAWGAPAAARRAVAMSGDTLTAAPLGATIDGSAVQLQGIAPERLDLAVFYDPATLEPAMRGGNQLILLSFEDDGVEPVAARTLWQLDARRADGSPLTANPIASSGVTTTDLVAVLGTAAEGASGSIQFTTADGAQNRLIFFVEALGTFATGYQLPPVAP